MIRSENSAILCGVFRGAFSAVAGALPSTIALILALPLALALFLTLASDNFLSWANLNALILGLSFNAIVAVDGMKVRMEQGADGLVAAKEVVSTPTVPRTTMIKTILKTQVTKFSKNFFKLSS